ncbi:MAG: hypothetical protein HGA28_04955 [Anaerolineaceae bacterium]|nr:hypothetical protein [Anaerolineaceae bacterium]
MQIKGVTIEDTFAEAFPIKMARILITGAKRRWAMVAAQEATGFDPCRFELSKHSI